MFVSDFSTVQGMEDGEIKEAVSFTMDVITAKYAILLSSFFFFYYFIINVECFRK